MAASLTTTIAHPPTGMRVHPRKTRANFAHTITTTAPSSEANGGGNGEQQVLRIERAELEVRVVRDRGGFGDACAIYTHDIVFASVAPGGITSLPANPKNVVNLSSFQASSA